MNRDLPGVEGARLYSKLNCCDWTDIEAEKARLVESIRAGEGACQPFALLSIAASAEIQRRSADFWIERLLGLAARKWVDAVPAEADKIRIGYLSADFRTHPVTTCYRIGEDGALIPSLVARRHGGWDSGTSTANPAAASV